jgi:hypothetical protein
LRYCSAQILLHRSEFVVHFDRRHPLDVAALMGVSSQLTWPQKKFCGPFSQAQQETATQPPAPGEAQRAKLGKVQQ